MHMFEAFLFPALWTAFLLLWQIMARNAKATERLEPPVSRVVRSVLFLTASALLLFPGILPPWLRWRFIPVEWGMPAFWCGAAITVAGLLFAVWARLHLGRNWSRSVTIKKEHELIDSGPYALVRHPIYTGLLTGFAGTAIATGELRGILALGMIFVALWAKLRLEERWMREHFGTKYETYSRRVAALVPFVL